MPTYEYQCTLCGQQLEAFQKMSEAPLTDCPQCQKPGLTKLVSAAGFQLKGSGWYVTDYSAKGKAKNTDSSGSSTAETSKKSDSSSSSDSGSSSA